MQFTRKYWTVLRVGLVLLWVRFLLRGKSLPLVLNRLSRGSIADRPDEQEMRKLAYYVDCWLQVVPYNVKGNCFPRSLALYWLARQLGYPVVFYCGVRKEASKLNGHAWLTLDRLSFLETGQHWQHYTVTFSYPQDLGAAVRRDHSICCRSKETEAS